MTTARVYPKDEFWFVDYIDNNYELLPAVGIFKTKEEAERAAKAWSTSPNVEGVGEGTW
jgi:Uri superfamily endonuclease